MRVKIFRLLIALVYRKFWGRGTIGGNVSRHVVFCWVKVQRQEGLGSLSLKKRSSLKPTAKGSSALCPRLNNAEKFTIRKTTPPQPQSSPTKGGLWQPAKDHRQTFRGPPAGQFFLDKVASLMLNASASNAKPGPEVSKFVAILSRP